MSDLQPAEQLKGCCSVYLADQQTRRSPSLFGHSTLQIWLPPSRANALHHAHHWTPAVKVEEEALRPGTPDGQLELLPYLDFCVAPLAAVLELHHQGDKGCTSHAWDEGAASQVLHDPVDIDSLFPDTAHAPKLEYASSNSVFETDIDLLLPPLEGHEDCAAPASGRRLGLDPAPSAPPASSSCTQDLLDEMLGTTMPSDPFELCSPAPAGSDAARQCTPPAHTAAPVPADWLTVVPVTPDGTPRRASGSRGRKGPPRPASSSSDSDSSCGRHAPPRRRKHHKAWTARETEALLEGVEACGQGSWAAIKRLGKPCLAKRSSVDLKDKWRNLRRAAASAAAPIRMKPAAVQHLERTRSILEETE